MDYSMPGKQAVKATESFELAKKREVLAYGMGGFGRCLFNSTALGLLNYFYTNSIGMSAAIIGMIFMFSRVLDGLVGMSIGMLIDKLNPKFGKVKSWLLWSAVPFGIVTLMLFTVPDTSLTGKVIYIIILYNLMTSVFETTFYVPQLTFPALITADKGQRTQLTIVNQIFGMLAGFIPSMILLPMILDMGNKQSDWIKVISFIIPIGVVSMLIDAFVCKERVCETSAKKAKEGEAKSRYGVKNTFKAMLQNKYWLMVFGIFIFDALSNQFFSAAGVYYSQYCLGDASTFGGINMAFTLPVILSLFLSGSIVKKFTKRDIFLTGAIIKLLGLLLVVLLPVSYTNVLIGRGIAGLGTGITFSVMYAFVIDTMDYGQWKTGIRLESTLQSGLNIGMNIGVGLAPGLSGWMMSMSGYDGLAASQPQSAINVINFCATWVPVIFAVLLVAVIWFYDLDKKYPQIVKELRERKQAAQAAQIN